MKNDNNIQPGELFALSTITLSIAGILLLAAFASGCAEDNAGELGDCENFPDAPWCVEPTCVEQVTDECVPEVVDAFCIDAPYCDLNGARLEGYEQGLARCGDLDEAYNEGYEDGVESVDCEPLKCCWKRWNGRWQSIECGTTHHIHTPEGCHI